MNKLRIIFKDLLPPILWRQLRRVKTILGIERPMYEPQVFGSPKEIPPFAENAWASKNWTESQYIFTASKTSDEEVALNVYQPLNVNASSLLLASLISVQASELPKAIVSIIDIGGGLSGGFYPECQKYLSAIGLGMKYAVVDGRVNCEFGERFFQSQKNIKFYDFEAGGLGSAARSFSSIDVCNLSSTLQYIIDWRSAIASILNFKPRLVVISRTPFSDSAEKEAYGVQHVTTHKGYCGKVKVVMIPRQVLLFEMERQGYDCLAEHGISGDASWYWQAGCKRREYFFQTVRSFVFVRRSFGKSA